MLMLTLAVLVLFWSLQFPFSPAQTQEPSKKTKIQTQLEELHIQKDQ
jgi:hypothetical protein